MMLILLICELELQVGFMELISVVKNSIVRIVLLMSGNRNVKKKFCVELNYCLWKYQMYVNVVILQQKQIIMFRVRMVFYRVFLLIMCIMVQNVEVMMVDMMVVYLGVKNWGFIFVKDFGSVLQCFIVSSVWVGLMKVDCSDDVELVSIVSEMRKVSGLRMGLERWKKMFFWMFLLLSLRVFVLMLVNMIIVIVSSRQSEMIVSMVIVVV